MDKSAKPSKERFLVLLLLFFIVAINYLDRANLSVAASAMQDYFQLSPAQLGVLFSAFTWAYFMAQIPIGFLLDKIGPRYLYGVAIILWGAFTFIMAFSSHGFFATASSAFTFLLLCRVLIGVAEAPAYPCNTKIASLWFPTHERGRAISTYSAAQYIGLALFVPLLAWMIEAYNWESVFYVSGGVAIIFGVIWLIVYRDPKDSTRVNQAELDYLKAHGGYNPDVDGAEKIEKVTWREIRYVLGLRSIWGIFLIQFATASTLYFFLTWFIIYLQKGLHLSINQAGIAASLPYLMAMVGVMAGGSLSDYLIKRGKSITYARKLPMVLGVFVSSLLCLANFFETSPMIALIILSIAFFANSGANLGWVALSDILPKKMVGTIGGFLNCFGNLSGIITPIAFGALLESTNSFHLAMYYISAVSFIGGLGFLIAVDKLETVDLKKAQTNDEKSIPS